MTKQQIDAVLEAVRSWPQEDQEELAEIARAIEARRTGVYRLSDAERRGIERGLKAMREGRFASDERVAEVFAKARSSGA
jgi:predicted transcriptional regulator